MKEAGAKDSQVKATSKAELPFADPSGRSFSLFSLEGDSRQGSPVISDASTAIKSVGSDVSHGQVRSSVPGFITRLHRLFQISSNCMTHVHLQVV